MYTSSVEWQRLRNEKGERERFAFPATNNIFRKFFSERRRWRRFGYEQQLLTIDVRQEHSLAVGDTGGKSLVAASVGNSSRSIRSCYQMSRLWPF